MTDIGFSVRELKRNVTPLGKATHTIRKCSNRTLCEILCSIRNHICLRPRDKWVAGKPSHKWGF